MDERSYWLGFSVFPGIGPKRFTDLLNVFGTAEGIWHAPIQELKKSFGETLSFKFDTFRSDFSLPHYVEKLHKKNVKFLTLRDASYPKLLRQTKNPPFVLYVRGEFDFNAVENQKTIGIVGTRKISSYGREVTEMFTRSLVENNFVVVSGLAMGVDAVAHKAAVEGGGKTVAVLGSGVDVCHPSVNQKIYTSIIDGHGAVVSEYSLGQAPSKGSFPSRNRIIAGLSQAVLVTEGAADSGALYTADDAFTVGRKVFAIPGPITSSLSQGPFSLLQKGAVLVTSPDTILNELGATGKAKSIGEKIVKGDNAEEQKVIDLLAVEPLFFDEIVQMTGIDSIRTGIILSNMELKGTIKSSDEAGYSLIR